MKKFSLISLTQTKLLATAGGHPGQANQRNGDAHKGVTGVGVTGPSNDFEKPLAGNLRNLVSIAGTREGLTKGAEHDRRVEQKPEGDGGATETEVEFLLRFFLFCGCGLSRGRRLGYRSRRNHSS